MWRSAARILRAPGTRKRATLRRHPCRRSSQMGHPATVAGRALREGRFPVYLKVRRQGCRRTVWCQHPSGGGRMPPDSRHPGDPEGRPKPANSRSERSRTEPAMMPAASGPFGLPLASRRTRRRRATAAKDASVFPKGCSAGILAGGAFVRGIIRVGSLRPSGLVRVDAASCGSQTTIRTSQEPPASCRLPR